MDKVIFGLNYNKGRLMSKSFLKKIKCFFNGHLFQMIPYEADPYIKKCKICETFMISRGADFWVHEWFFRKDKWFLEWKRFNCTEKMQNKYRKGAGRNANG